MQLVTQLEDFEKRLGICGKIQRQLIRKGRLINNLQEIQKTILLSDQ